jgi:DNA-binding response OmpR family regulator
MIATTCSHTQARTLLVVSDNADTQTVILEHARAKGHAVISASTPALGLTTFDMTQPDIVIIDLFLPEQDGMMLVKQIRERRPTCPVLLLTDAGHAESTMEWLRAGALDYVQQPIHEDAFAQVLQRAIHSLPASMMDETVVLDLSEALSRADGDQDSFLTMARLFLQESPREAAAARVALGRQDQAGLAAAAHKLKGSVMEICAPRLFERTKRLEELGRQGEFAEASPVCADVEICLAEVHAALREVIAGGFPLWWLQLVRIHRHVPCSSLPTMPTPRA